MSNQIDPIRYRINTLRLVSVAFRPAGETDEQLDAMARLLKRASAASDPTDLMNQAGRVVADQWSQTSTIGATIITVAHSNGRARPRV